MKWSHVLKVLGFLSVWAVFSAGAFFILGAVLGGFAYFMLYAFGIELKYSATLTVTLSTLVGLFMLGAVLIWFGEDQ